MIKYTLFCKATLSFNSASVLLSLFMNSASHVAQVLLVAHNHHCTETHFIFSIFATMSWYSSVMSYLYDLFFIFTLIYLITIDHVISLRQTHLFFVIFLEYLIYQLWMVTWLKKVNNFQIAKVQPQAVDQLLLIFLPISPWWCCL